MIKILIGFIIFAAIAMFVLMKGGDNVSLQGETEGAHHEEKAAPTTTPAATPATPAAAPAETTAPATAPAAAPETPATPADATSPTTETEKK
ncbi:hypothetical protein ACMYR3_11510 [Ampullimonas aquatilis]|uniref:hypothetical protein n=1 Tax=Ampullimonas aquatilis TaxID=1341549 RepID=UPI003C74A5E7